MASVPASDVSWPVHLGRDGGDTVEIEFRGESFSRKRRWLEKAIPYLIIVMLALFVQTGQSQSDKNFMPRSSSDGNLPSVDNTLPPLDSDTSQRSPPASLISITQATIKNVQCLPPLRQPPEFENNASVRIAKLFNYHPLWSIKDNNSLEVQLLFSQSPDPTGELAKERLHESTPFRPIVTWQRLPMASWLAGKLRGGRSRDDCHVVIDELSQGQHCSCPKAKMTWYEIFYALLFGALGLARCLLKPEQRRPQQPQQQPQQQQQQ